MRISEWSSDVCSSDLHSFSVGARLARDYRGRTHGGGPQSCRDALQHRRIDVQRRRIVFLRVVGIGLLLLFFGRFQLGLRLCVLVARSEEHTSELPSLMRISYAVFCLQKKKTTNNHKSM